tara:strand:- start:267 stop:557 length:291 start_codon:yes stop_codon:yes gene_type:complete
MSKVEEVAIEKGTPCKDKRPMVLASVVPKPPGINEIAPISEAVVWANIDPSQLIDKSKPFKIIKKLVPSRTHENIPRNNEILIIFGDIKISIISKL